MDFLTSLSSSYLSIIGGTEDYYDSFWPQRIRNLGAIFGQEPIYNETYSKLHDDNITYFKDFLDKDYADDNVQIFAVIKETSQLKLLLDNLGSGTNEKRKILFMINGLTEKEIIDFSQSNYLNDKLADHSILHLYGNYTDYEEFMKQFTLTNPLVNPDEDVFMYIYIYIYKYAYMIY